MIIASTSTLWDRLVVNFLGKALEPAVDPLTRLVEILGGLVFGVLVIGLVIVILRYFVRWGYEEISIKRGRDSFGRRVSDKPRPPSKSARTKREARHRRESCEPGIRRRT